VDYRTKKTEETLYANEYNDKSQLIFRATAEESSTYEYDENGKLIHEIIENQKDDTYQDIQYTYDIHGNLLLKVIEKTSAGVTSTVNHVYEYGIRYMP
jgi:YD repeat-containing protein